MLSDPVQQAACLTGGPVTQPWHGSGSGIGAIKLPPKVASLPVTASSTIEEPIESKAVVVALDGITFHWWPFHVHMGATIGNTGHCGCVTCVPPICIGQAIAGCADPRAGSANGPRVRSTARPVTGSVARVPLPKTTSGVEPEAFDQSVPFHNQVAALGDM